MNSSATRLIAARTLPGIDTNQKQPLNTTVAQTSHWTTRWPLLDIGLAILAVASATAAWWIGPAAATAEVFVVKQAAAPADGAWTFVVDSGNRPGFAGRQYDSMVQLAGSLSEQPSVPSTAHLLVSRDALLANVAELTSTVRRLGVEEVIVSTLD